MCWRGVQRGRSSKFLILISSRVLLGLLSILFHPIRATFIASNGHKQTPIPPSHVDNIPGLYISFNILLTAFVLGHIYTLFYITHLFHRISNR